jgi:hypothetical protein
LGGGGFTVGGGVGGGGGGWRRRSGGFFGEFGGIIGGGDYFGGGFCGERHAGRERSCPSVTGEEVGVEFSNHGAMFLKGAIGFSFLRTTEFHFIS